MHGQSAYHRGAWCPALPLPLMETVIELEREASDSFQTSSTFAGPQSEDQDDFSDASAPEWTPRVSPRQTEEKAPSSEAEVQPPWVQMSERDSKRASGDRDLSQGLDKLHGSGPSKPPLVPRLPQMFNVFTPRSPRQAQKQDSPGYAHSGCLSSRSLLGAPRSSGNDALRVGIPCGVPLQAGMDTSPGLKTARREVAEAHVELLARAADLRRREKRLHRMQHKGGNDKENFAPASGRSYSSENFSNYSAAAPSKVKLDGVHKTVSAPIDLGRPERLGQGSGPLPARSRAKTVSPRRSAYYESMAPRRAPEFFSPREARVPLEARTPREMREVREIREVRSRRSHPTVACTDSEARRIRKEIRLERRLRRRAEEAATAVWRNALLIAGAVSLCVVGVISLSVAIAIRR